VSFVPAKGDRTFGTCTQFVFVADGHALVARQVRLEQRLSDMNTLPVKPGYTAVEVKMPQR